jgi:murein DD-endopeptidase MepM/ murein hydrolase activator NlpD
MKKLLTFLVLVGLLLSLQVSFVSAQESDPPPEVTTYEVKEGDTAESIAAEFGISVEDLLAANDEQLDGADDIEVGMTLVIPEPADEPVDEPLADEPPTDEPPVDEPPADEPPVDEPPADEAPADEPPVDEPPVDEAPADEAPADEAPVDEAPVDEAPVDEQPVDEQPADKPPADDESKVDGPVSERAGEGAEAPASEGDVGTAGSLPGTFTSQIIAIANLLDSGAAETPVLTLYDIDSSSDSVVGSMPSVYPGGVGFVTDGQIPTGRHAGVIESSFPAAVVALTVNASAGTADAYPAVSEPANELFGTLIFNKHFNWESTLTCQNTGGGPTSITAILYKAGDTSPKVTLTANNVEANNSVIWDIADNSTVQSQWPGGNGEFGYAKFTSANGIACVIQNDKIVSGQYVSSQFQAVPASYESDELFAPVIFNGHGSSKKNVYANKWISGISIVNQSGGDANVGVTYTGDNGTYTHTCTRTLGGGSSITWYAPEMGTGSGAGAGWNCPSGTIQWVSGTTFGSAKVTASGSDVLVIGNSNKYDIGGLGSIGYSGLAATSSVASPKAICPLAFNLNPNDNYASGIPVVNMGNGPTTVTLEMVRADVNPALSGNSTEFTCNLDAGKSCSIYFPEESTALKNFQGAVFVESTSQPVAVQSSTTNYSSSINAGVLYDCINY